MNIMYCRAERCAEEALNAENMEQVRELRGEIVGIRYWQALPSVVLNELQKKEKEENASRK